VYAGRGAEPIARWKASTESRLTGYTPGSMMPRRLVPELMDAPDVDPREHRRALAGLGRINALSGAAQRMTAPIVRFAREVKKSKLTLLDIASGGGDVPISIALALRSHGMDVDLTLFDQSDVGLVPAVERATQLRISARAVGGNAIEALPQHSYDVVTCSLFLHHLSEDDVVRLLGNARAATRGLLVISDLERSRAGLFAAKVGCHVLSRSPLVHHDGPASVRAAWTRKELHDLARRAKIDNPRIDRVWPWRLLLTWRSG
jgi:2-polyprenyl-3-methyl-5-hydroxy-6-metoxy-1,4-benzoquinol methylase